MGMNIVKISLKIINRRLFMKKRDDVRIKEVRENGVIIYDVDSILKSAPAKRHFKFLRKLWDEQKKTDRTKK